MADRKVVALPSLSGSLALTDLIHVVDISDTSEDPSGTSKKIEMQKLYDILVGGDKGVTWEEFPSNYGVITSANHSFYRHLISTKTLTSWVVSVFTAGSSTTTVQLILNGSVIATATIAISGTYAVGVFSAPPQQIVPGDVLHINVSAYTPGTQPLGLNSTLIWE